MSAIFIILTIFVLILYIFVRSFRLKVNDTIMGIFYWLVNNIHIPTWIVEAVRFLWRVLRPTIFVFLAIAVIMAVAWGVSFAREDATIVTYAALLSAIVCFVGIILSEITKGTRKLFGGTGLSGPIQKVNTTMMLWASVVLALLSFPEGYFFSATNLWILSMGTLVLVIWMVVGWYNNSPITIGATFLKWVFIVTILFSSFQNWNVGNWQLWDAAEAWARKIQTKVAREASRDDIKSKKTLAVFTQPGYWFEDNGGKPKVTTGRYLPGQQAALADSHATVVKYGPELYYEVYKDQGNYFGGDKMYVLASTVETTNFFERVQNYNKNDSTETQLGYSLVFAKPLVQLEVGRKIIAQKSPKLLDKRILVKFADITMVLPPGRAITVEKVYQSDESFTIIPDEPGKRIHIKGEAIKLPTGDVKIEIKIV